MNHIKLTNDLLSELSLANPERFLEFCYTRNHENLPKRVVEHMEILIDLVEHPMEYTHDFEVNQEIYQKMNGEVSDRELASFETSQEIVE